MHIIFFTHPAFQSHQSMPRYAHWLANGMMNMGHTVELWTAPPVFHKLPVPAFAKKWLGYIDLFLLFPNQSRKKIKQYGPDTLFVFTDHALGPWVPLVAGRKHIVHCHDFLAQKSALGEIPQNPTSYTGRQYQAYIRSGYSKGKNFISISEQTRKDLHHFLKRKPAFSEVVYNAVNNKYRQVPHQTDALAALQQTTGLELSAGFLLHIGGNQWYKNRSGIVMMYAAWRQEYSTATLPLLLIGEKPDIRLLEAALNSPFSEDIHFLSGLGDNDLLNAYNTATAFLFPSLAEGFGWPIAEAMACGCPVITTNEAPMTEVGGNAAIYLPKMPLKGEQLQDWLKKAATQIQQVISLSGAERVEVIQKGLRNVQRFDSATQLAAIEKIYRSII